MPATSGKSILDEFFNSWTEKVKAGKTPAEGLEEIRREDPELFDFAEIFNPRKKDGGK